VELPHLQTLYQKVKSQNVGIVAMNNGDSADVITTYWKKGKFTFPAVMAERSVHRQFGVRAYPSNYVLDGVGVVVARMVGYNEGALKAALVSKGVRVN